MKKAASAILVVLLLLNVMGYYAVFVGIKYQNTRQLIQKFDADDYDQSRAVTLKVPISIPYYQDTEYERVNGEIEHNGEFYHLVKQKFAKDTIYIVCIKDVKSKEIKQALSDYVKTFTDQNTSAPQTKVFSFIQDYITTQFSIISSTEGWNVSLAFSSREETLSLPVLFRFSPPPEA